MSVKSIMVIAATSLLLIGPWSDAMAQRGGRGGDGGGGRGRGSSDGGNSDSNSGGNRSFRADGGSQHSSNASPTQQQHQSFYRGSDSDHSSRNDRDNGDAKRSFSRSENSNRDGGRDRDFSDRMRRNFGGNDRHDLPFRYGWWDSYGLAGYPIYSPWRYSQWRDRPYYWWGASSPRGLTQWLVYGFTEPAYWSYGSGRNIWYDNDYVYYDGRRTMSADRYYSYLDGLARDIPDISEADAKKMDWKPLGVFAVRRENDSESDRTLQLAVNRDGVIAGTYFLQQKKEARPLSGRVDEHSQRATWTFADGKKGENDVVFETSIYNLTKDSTNVMVHFGPKASDAEIWQLVRLEQPDAKDATVSSTQ